MDMPGDRAGQVVACPGCGGQMQLPALSVEPSPAGAGVPVVAANGEAETRACPRCGGTILRVARKCKHCGSFAMVAAAPPAGWQTGKLAPRERVRQRRSGDGRTALIFALIGLVPICAVICNVAGLTRSLSILGLFVFIMPVFALLAVIYGRSARKYEEERRLATAGLALGLAEFGLVAVAVLYLVCRLASR